MSCNMWSSENHNAIGNDLDHNSSNSTRSDLDIGHSFVHNLLLAAQSNTTTTTTIRVSINNATSASAATALLNTITSASTLATTAGITDESGDTTNSSRLLHIGVRMVRHTEISDFMLLWAAIDISLLLWIFAGNTLTICAICMSRKLRAITSNWFVLSLAMSDLLVGFTLPYHVAFYTKGSLLGREHVWCLLRFFLIIIACCVSIWNLIAIGVDRYVAIVYPLHYVRFVTRRVAVGVMCSGWAVGVGIGAVPMVWNNWGTALECEFDEVLPPWYMVGVVTPLFSAVWLCMLALYVRIWSEAARQARQMRSSICVGMRERGAAGDRKSVQLVLLILGCFTFCWLPYFIVACAQMFGHREQGSPTIYKATFSLAMANSGMNPMIYAWKNPALRRAFCRLLRGKHPDHMYDQWEATDADADDAKRQRRRRARLQQWQPPPTGLEVGAAVEAAAPRASAETLSSMARRVEQRSCCQLDDWSKGSVGAASSPSATVTTDGLCAHGHHHHRLMDILHIDAGPAESTQTGRKVRLGTATNANDKWMNHRISYQV